ncbi:MAG: hypothetical protein ACMUIA_09030 [bacterium]
MIVIYSLPNMLSLPYQIDREKGHYTFRPGENQVPDRIWEAIKSQNKARFDNYYSSIMWEVHLPPEAVNPTSSINPPDEEEALSRHDNLPTSSINPPDEESAFSPCANFVSFHFNPPDEGAAASGEPLVDISGIDQIRQVLVLIENTMGLEEPNEEYRELTKARLALIEHTMGLEKPNGGYRELTAARLDLIEYTMGLEKPGACLHDEKHSENQLKRPGRAAARAINGRMAGINNFAARIREKKGTAKVNELVQNFPAHLRAPPRAIAGHCREPTTLGVRPCGSLGGQALNLDFQHFPLRS